MAENSAKLSPPVVKKKRSVQFLADDHLVNGVNCGSGSHEEAGFSKNAGSTSSESRPRCKTSSRCVSDDDDGNPITVHRPEDAPKDIAVFEVGLGMLRQHTIYAVQFLLPAEDEQLSTDKVEVVRSAFVNAQSFELSAIVDFELIEYIKVERAYKMKIKFSTGSLPHILESFALREIDNYDNCIYFSLKCEAMRKGHGTPSLRLGIHQIGHTAEYEESDEKTEWQGFE